jgi:hypothetical protein
MKLSIRTLLDYDIPDPCDILLELEAAIIPEQDVLSAHIDLPHALHFARVPGHDTIGDRIWLRHQGKLLVTYTGLVDVHRIAGDIAHLAAVPPHRRDGAIPAAFALLPVLRIPASRR